jgi:hypothetical protein
LLKEAAALKLRITHDFQLSVYRSGGFATGQG